MPFRSILVVKPSSLGDVVHTLPAVARVRRAWPGAKLRWLINPEWAPLLEGNPDLDGVIPFPRRELRGLGALPKQLGWLKQMRASYPSDLVLDFQGLLRSAIIGRACRNPAGGKIVGLSDAREGARFLYDEVATVGREHAVDRYLKLVGRLGLDTAPPLDWPLPEGTQPAGFDLDEPFVLLHPFSRGAGKSLSVEQVKEFCSALPCRVVVAGRTPERVGPIENALDLLNQTTIAELIWLIRRARFVVSVDSGPMHIAAALTPNLLSIHMWSDPALVGPYNPEAWVLKDRTLFQVRCMNDPIAKRPAVPDLQAVAAFVEHRLA